MADATCSRKPENRAGRLIEWRLQLVLGAPACRHTAQGECRSSLRGTPGMMRSGTGGTGTLPDALHAAWRLGCGLEKRQQGPVQRNKTGSSSVSSGSLNQTTRRAIARKSGVLGSGYIRREPRFQGFEVSVLAINLNRYDCNIASRETFVREETKAAAAAFASTLGCAGLGRVSGLGGILGFALVAGARALLEHRVLAEGLDLGAFLADDGDVLATGLALGLVG